MRVIREWSMIWALFRCWCSITRHWQQQRPLPDLVRTANCTAQSYFVSTRAQPWSRDASRMATQNAVRLRCMACRQSEECMTAWGANVDNPLSLAYIILIQSIHYVNVHIILGKNISLPATSRPETCEVFEMRNPELFARRQIAGTAERGIQV